MGVCKSYFIALLMRILHHAAVAMMQTDLKALFGKGIKKKPVRTELAGSSSNVKALHTQLDV